MSLTQAQPVPMLDLYILTFNCAHNLVDIPTFSASLFNATDHLPELLVISLQEATPMSHGLIGGSLLTPYTNRVEDAVEIAARKMVKSGDEMASGPGQNIYAKVAQHNIGMVILLVFSLDSTAVSDTKRGGVGLGVNGMANKGAAGLRFKYHDKKAGKEAWTELTFVAAHLAAMEWELERRNEDWANICRGLVFTPDNPPSSASSRQNRIPVDGTADSPEESQALLSQGGEDEEGIFTPTSHLFIAGDLNYRTSALAPGPDDHTTSFPIPNPKGGDSDAQNYSVYYADDQLNEERLGGHTMHGLSEFPVTFPPTYKYDYKKGELITDGEGEDRWTWAQHRWPSWTDRILYLDLPHWLRASKPSANIELNKYDCLPLMPMSDHRAVVLSVKVSLMPIPEPEDEESEDSRVRPPFEMVRDWKERRAKARKEELMLGIGGFLTATWEGWCIALGTLAGIMVVYFLFKVAFDA